MANVCHPIPTLKMGLSKFVWIENKSVSFAYGAFLNDFKQLGEGVVYSGGIRYE